MYTQKDHYLILCCCCCSTCQRRQFVTGATAGWSSSWSRSRCRPRASWSPAGTCRTWPWRAGSRASPPASLCLPRTPGTVSRRGRRRGGGGGGPPMPFSLAAWVDTWADRCWSASTPGCVFGGGGLDQRWDTQCPRESGVTWRIRPHFQSREKELRRR